MRIYARFCLEDQSYNIFIIDRLLQKV